LEQCDLRFEVGGEDTERIQRLVFGEVAAEYDNVRPSYPPALVDRVMEYGSLRPGDRALEVGSGTGKATILFARRGLSILCLEPSPGMATVAKRNCAFYPQVSIVVSSLEEWQGEPGAFDLLLSAQSWHWIDPHVGYAKAHDVLVPFGVLALFWNRLVWKDVVLRHDLKAVYARVAPELATNSPGFLGLDGREDPSVRAREIAESGLFDDVSLELFQWSKDYQRDRYLQLLNTQSHHRMLPEDKRRRLLEAVAGLIDERGGKIRVDYSTELYLARSKP
jgi:SAM-dependent methyltransferase